MQNNIIKKISPGTRLICLLILTISLILANSIFLILFITTLTIILIMITGKSVNLYVNIIKKSYILLLFFLIIYILIFKCNIVNCIFFSYKLIILLLLFSIFNFNMCFGQLHQAIYYSLSFLEIIKINVEKISFDIVIALYFFKKIISNSYNLFNFKKIYGRKKQRIKNSFLSILLKTDNELNEFQNCLKVKNYKLKKESKNLFSKIILISIIILFVFVVFKEVIL